ncbi:MAG TPA: hypothetical protein VIX58_05240 [Anaerolineae bacterium]
MNLGVFVFVFGLALFLQRWLHKHIQGFTYLLTEDPGCALRALFFLLLPGVLLHEGSHWLVANVLGVKTGKVTIGLARARGKMMSLGSVNVERTDVMRESLIGIAPFLFGLVAIVLIAGFGFGLWANAPFDARHVLDIILPALADWPAWVYLYLVFAVSTSMIPSESDREPWGLLILFFCGIALAAWLLGWLPRVTPEMIKLSNQVLDTLNLALGVSVAVNGVVAFVLWILEVTVGSVTQRRVRY